MKKNLFLTKKKETDVVNSSCFASKQIKRLIVTCAENVTYEPRVKKIGGFKPNS